MKKLLVVLGIVSLGVIGFAGAKEDYEKVETLVKENREEEAFELLEKIANSNEGLYTEKAAFQLGNFYVNTGNINEGKKYFNLVVNSNQMSKEDKKVALVTLLKIAVYEKNVTDSKKYLEILNNNVESVNDLSLIITSYKELGMEKEANDKYNFVMNSKKELEDYKANLNYNIGAYYLNKNNEDEARKYFEKAYNLSKRGTIEAGRILAQLDANKGDVKRVEARLLDINDKTGNKDTDVLDMLASFYLQMKDFDKAEQYYTRISKANKDDLDIKVILLGIYNEKNDKIKYNTMYNQLKSYVPEGEFNRTIAFVFSELGNTEMAEKFLLKSINEDKDNETMLYLAELYYINGEETKAIETLNKAIKLNVEGASNMLEEIQKAKANVQ